MRGPTGAIQFWENTSFTNSSSRPVMVGGERKMRSRWVTGTAIRLGLDGGEEGTRNLGTQQDTRGTSVGHLAHGSTRQAWSRTAFATGWATGTMAPQR